MRVGQKVHYIPYIGCEENHIENGIVKSMNDNNIFVVFNCNNDWDKFENYTGQSVKLNQLKEGWYGFTPESFNPYCSDNNYHIFIHKGDQFHMYYYSEKWKIKLYEDGMESMLYDGKIPNDEFGFQLLKNLGILKKDEILRINRELSIEKISRLFSEDLY